MIKFVILAVCVILVILIIRKLSFKRKLKKAKKNKPALPENFTVTAHAGSMGTKDNTYNSVYIGAQNADIIELDVKFAKDGTPVLAHTEVKNDSVLLKDAFALIAERKNLMANLDIKDKDERLIRILALARAYGIKDRIFFTGVEEEYVDTIKENCPGIAYYLNVNVDKKERKNAEYINSLVEKVRDCGAVGINMNKKGISKELIAAFRENGLLVSVWTVNSEKEILKMLSLAPDNITTRKPDFVMELVK